MANAYVDTHRWPAKCGTPKSTLVITLTEFEALVEQMFDERCDSDTAMRLMLKLVEDSDCNDPLALCDLRSRVC